MEQEVFEIKVQIKDDGSTATLTNLATKAKVSGVEVDALKAKYQGLATAMAGSSTNIKMTADSFQDFASKAQGASRASGGAASSVMELGRVMSDAPYGIRGVANNLSQLASNMLFTAQQVDKTTGKVIGFSGVISQMGKAFMGPLGILVAIQGLLALLETLSNSAGKAQKSMNEFTYAGITTTVVRLGYLKDVLNDSNVSLEEKTEMVNRANGEFKDLNLTLTENGELTTASANSLQSYTAELMKAATAAAVMEEMTTMTKDAMKLMVDGPEGFMSYLARIGGMAAGMSWEHAGKVYANDLLKDIAERMDKFKQFMSDNGLNPYVFNPKEANTENKKNAEKVVKRFFLDLEREINAYAQRFSEANTRNIWELLNMEQGAETDALTKQWTDYQAKLDLQETYLAEKLRKGLVSETFYNEQMAQLAEDGKQGEREYQIAMDNLKLAQDAETNRKMEDARRDHLANLRALEMEGNLLTQELTGLNFEYEDDYLRQHLADIQTNYEDAQADLYVKKMEAFEAGQELGAFEKEAKNLTLQRDLDVAATEGELAENRIETMQHVGNAFAAVSDLVGKETAAGKALAIAAATIDTYVAGVQTMKDPTIPNGPAKVAAMIAVIASGLATVKKIASTKVPGSSGSTGSAGGSSGPEFRPDFNIVGNSGQNQLAETVAGRTNEATRAYVVYDDLAEADALQSNSVASASFG